MGKLGTEAVYRHPDEGWAIEKDAQHLVAMSLNKVERFKVQEEEEASADFVAWLRTGLKDLGYTVEDNVFEGREC